MKTGGISGKKNFVFTFHSVCTVFVPFKMEHFQSFWPLKNGMPVVCGAKAVNLSPNKSSWLGKLTVTRGSSVISNGLCMGSDTIWE